MKYTLIACLMITLLGLLSVSNETSDVPVFPESKSAYANTTHDCTEIIEQTTDERGLTSVVYTEGSDTFALDFLTPEELNTLCNN